MWALLEPVFRAGETFPHDPAITEAEAWMAWVEQNQAVMVAVDVAGALVGTYYLRPNSLTLGAHVANAGYVVAEQCRREGIGSRLCQHSLNEARRLGFRANGSSSVLARKTFGRPARPGRADHVASSITTVAPSTAVDAPLVPTAVRPAATVIASSSFGTSSLCSTTKPKTAR